jgi:purine-binding chemotaxis protein CheW
MEVSEQNSGCGVVEIAHAARAGKYLTFTMSDEIYGLEILKVQEIIGMMRVTHVPKMPSSMRGVINLRGKVIPVVDLRVRFGMESKPDDERTCIIVLQIRCGLSAVTTGILVDEVSEVLDIQASQIEGPPSFGTSAQTDFLLGIGKIGQKVVILLDVDRVLSSEEIAMALQAPK